MILSDAGADAMLAGNFSTSCNNGWIKIYSGTAPATANAAITGTLLVGDARFNATAFGAPGATAGGRIITAAAITSDSAADAGGTPTHFRAFKLDGTTVMFQGTVTVTGSGGEMTIDSVPIVQNAPINITGLTVTMPTT